MIITPNISIKIIRRPDASISTTRFVDLLCRKHFPRSHNIAQPKPINLLNYDMDVVGHDAPSQKAVPNGVKMQ